MKLPQSITRKQLQSLGLSPYLATAITKNLSPSLKKNRVHYYNLRDVISAIRSYLNRPRIKQQTRQLLTSILPVLLQRLNNVVAVNFGAKRGSDPELSRLAKKLYLELQKFY